jgi:nucleoside-diphosphate-sugar epimerase
MKKVFIAGCGYIGERIARAYQEAGADVTCSVRGIEHAAQLEQEGFTAVAAPFDSAETLPELSLADCILFYLVPPPGGGITDSRARNFIARISPTGAPEKIVYMSATSVYSSSEGESVSEESPALPDSAMGKRRLDAECAFREYGAAQGVPVIILRVSGIYGPGRLPLMQISQGQPLLREEESGPSNRIHAEDLTTVCRAAAESCSTSEIFNVSDGQPSSMTAYFNACADALGLPRQPQVTMEEARQVMSPLMLSYVSQSRVIENRRMRERLKVELRYKNLAQGLAASLPRTETVGKGHLS